MSEEKTGIEYNPKLTGEELKAFVSPEPKYVVCPFCEEFHSDLLGLKFHLEKKFCDIYNKTHICCPLCNKMICECEK